jgi:hypothetical protein
MLFFEQSALEDGERTKQVTIQVDFSVNISGGTCA